MRSNIQHSDISSLNPDMNDSSSQVQGPEQKRAPSIVAVRRGGPQEAAPLDIASSPHSDPLGKSQRVPFGQADEDAAALNRKHADDRLQQTVEHLSARIDALNSKLDAVSESVNFTEAYVAVEMVNRIAAAVEGRMAAVQAENVRGGRVLRPFGMLVLLAVIGLLIGGLVAEVSNDTISEAREGSFPSWLDTNLL